MGSSKSIYTVYSNCNGGQVYFDDVLVGTISGGKLEVSLSGNKSYSVRISGGVPSTSTSETSQNANGVDYTNEYSPSGNFRCSGHFYPTQGELVIQARADLVVTRSTYRNPYTYTIYYVWETRYTAPSNSTILPNSSVTMNYSSSESQINEYESEKTYSGKELDSTSNVSPTSGSISSGWVMFDGYRYNRSPNTAIKVSDITFIDTSIKGFTKGVSTTQNDRSYLRLDYKSTDGGYEDFLSVDFDL